MTSIRPVVIYALRDPQRPDATRYIGQTLQGVEKRRRQHVYRADRDASGKNLYSANWIKSLLRRGVEPVAVVLEETDQTNADNRERYWIARMLDEGHRLTNATTGGGANKIVAPHVRDRMRANTAHYFSDPARRAEHSARSKALWANPEWRARWMEGSASRLPTHCRAGHEYDAENTYVTPSGGRHCRICVAVYSARHRQKKPVGYQSEGRRHSAELTRERWADPAYRHSVTEKMKTTKRKGRASGQDARPPADD